MSAFPISKLAGPHLIWIRSLRYHTLDNAANRTALPVALSRGPASLNCV